MNKEELRLLAQMTSDNRHGQARQFIADHFKYLKQFAKLFKLVNKIHDLEGSIPKHIFEYRNELTKDMFKFISLYEDEEVTEQLRACL